MELPPPRSHVPHPVCCISVVTRGWCVAKLGCVSLCFSSGLCFRKCLCTCLCNTLRRCVCSVEDFRCCRASDSGGGGHFVMVNRHLCWCALPRVSIILLWPQKQKEPPVGPGVRSESSQDLSPGSYISTKLELSLASSSALCVLLSVFVLNCRQPPSGNNLPTLEHILYMAVENRVGHLV